MNQKDKPCYPKLIDDTTSGLTFRERLIIALASNSSLIHDQNGWDDYCVGNARVIIKHADAIIKELEKDTTMKELKNESEELENKLNKNHNLQTKELKWIQNKKP